MMDENDEARELNSGHSTFSNSGVSRCLGPLCRVSVAGTVLDVGLQCRLAGPIKIGTRH